MNQWRFKCACMNLIYFFHISSCYYENASISIQPYSQTVCFGESATFQCGGLGFDLYWYVDGKNTWDMTEEEKTERGLVLRSGTYSRRLLMRCSDLNSFMALAGNRLNNNSKIYCVIDGTYSDDCRGNETSDTVTLTVEGCDGGTSFLPSVSNTITSSSMKNQHNSTTDTPTSTMLTDSTQHRNTVIATASAIPVLLLLIIVVVVVILVAVVIRKKANRIRQPGNGRDNTIPEEMNSAYDDTKVNDESDNQMLMNSRGEDSSGNINEPISEDKNP